MVYKIERQGPLMRVAKRNSSKSLIISAFFSVENEINALGLAWVEVEIATLDRIGWGNIVETSCSVHDFIFKISKKCRK